MTDYYLDLWVACKLETRSFKRGKQQTDSARSAMRENSLVRSAASMRTAFKDWEVEPEQRRELCERIKYRDRLARQVLTSYDLNDTRLQDEILTF